MKNKIQAGLKWYWNKLNSTEPKDFFIGSVLSVAGLILIALVVGWIL